MARTSFTFFIILLLHLWTLYAQQDSDIKFQHLSVKDGLSQSTVNDILQDSDGFMWFATNDGVNRYDGRIFKAYRNLKTLDNRLISKITVLFEDYDKQLWVGTFGGGIFLYNKQKEEWINYLHNSKDNQTISNNNISGIIETKEGLWVSTYNGGLNLFDKKANTFTSVKLYKNHNTSLHSVIYTITSSSDNHLILGSSNGILKLNPENKTYSNYLVIDKYNKITNPGEPRAIYEDGIGNIWLGTENDGLFILNKGDTVFKKFIYPDKQAKKFAIRSLMEDDRQNIWIGYDGEGVGVYNLPDRSFSLLKNDEDNLNSIKNNTVYAIYQSNDGVIWLGNYAGGINIYDRKKNKFKTYRHVLNKENSLINNNVRTIYEDKKENIWIGTRNGMDLFDPKNNNFTHYRHQKDDPTSLSYDIVLDILEDSRGNFWVGTFSGGLNLFNRKKGAFKAYKNMPSDNNSLSNNNVYKIYEDSYNILWIGTLAGLNRFDTEKEKFIRYPFISGIKDIYEDHENRLLIGSDKGLLLFNRKTGTAKDIQANEDYRQVFCIFQDKNDTFYIGTEGAGILVFDKNLNYIQSITEKDGLPNNNVYGILEDRKSNLWISTNKGLTKYSIPENIFYYYDINDGLQGYEYNSGSYLKSSNEKFYFGGTNGFNVFEPGEIKTNTYIPNVLISEFKLFNKEIKVGTKNSPLEESILTANKIQLKHDKSAISLGFSCLNYTNPEKNQFAYMIDGFEDKWNYIGTSNQVTFTNLPPGKYVFKVKASNNDLLWNEQPDTLHIEVTPPLYKTWYAIVFYFLFVVLLLILFKQYTLIGVEEKSRLQIEKLERQKKEELNQLKLTFFTNISHEFRTPLTLILAPVQNILERYKNDLLLKKQLTLVENNAKKLLNLVNQLMDFRKIDQKKYELKLIYSDIIGYTREVVENFRQLALDKQITLNFFSEVDKLDTWFSSDVIDKVMYNLLSNAFKNTSPGCEVSIYISRINLLISKNKYQFFRKNNIPRFNKYIQIVVKDTGVGIEEKKLKKIFDRFYQIDKKDSLRSEGSGIGLALTKNLVNLHFGNIEVESKKDQGTRFYVQLPVIEKKFHVKEPPVKFLSEEEEYAIQPNIQYYNTNNTFIEAGSREMRKQPKSNEILIVDDDKDIVNFLRSLLEEYYTIHVAYNGKAAYELALEIIPDVIIADVMMPEMDGIEFCKAIKGHENTSHVPIILLTAKTSLEYKVEGFTTGADDYITKPFEPELLKVRVKNLVAARDKLKEKYNKKLSLEPSDSMVPSSDELFLQKLIKLIEDNMHNPDFMVDEIVDQIGMSRAVLYRKIKALTGQTVIDIVKAIRIKKAAKLLKSKKYSISEVAYNVGFNDPKYFAKCFKKEYNYSPRDYMNLDR